MIHRWMMGVIATLIGASAAQGEPMQSVRALFEGVWKRAGCNQPVETALNNVRYHELDGGYSLGMVLCWLGPSSQYQIFFLVAPKTNGRPQLIRFEEWIDQKFQPTDRLSMGEYNPEAKTITSFERYSSSGICGTAGEWTWTGTQFKMTGYWDKPDCNDDSEFDRGDRFRIFPPKK